MLKSKVIIKDNASDLEMELNNFLKKIDSSQLINLYYAANGDDYSSRRYSVIILYNVDVDVDIKLESDE